MNEIIAKKEEFKNKELQKYTDKINSVGERMRRNAYEVASILAKIDESKCYEDDGFKSTIEYANSVWGFGKSSAYSMIRIGRDYVDANKKSLESNLPHTPGEDWNVTQIEKMLPIPHADAEKLITDYKLLSPDMTTKEIEEIVKQYKENQKDVSESTESEAESETESETVIANHVSIIVSTEGAKNGECIVTLDYDYTAKGLKDLMRDIKAFITNDVNA